MKDLDLKYSMRTEYDRCVEQLPAAVCSVNVSVLESAYRMPCSAISGVNSCRIKVVRRHLIDSQTLVTSVYRAVRPALVAKFVEGEHYQLC